MDQIVPLLSLLVAVIALAGLAFVIFKGRNAQSSDLARMSQDQMRLEGHMQALAEAQAREQAELRKSLEARFDSITQRLGTGLDQHTEKTGAVIKQVHERLAVIDAAQENLKALSSQVNGLQELFSNKQSRGAFGEVQLHDLVADMLPPSAFQMQAVLSTGARADCLLSLPNPPGSIVMDAKFPLEAYRALMDAQDDASRLAAQRQFKADVLKHVKDIAAKYIVPGETAESAMMFLPSEAVYAELHTNFQEVVEQSYKMRVWIVSPTTTMALLNTVRAVLKDAHMREQAGVIQGEVLKLLEDVLRLDERVGKLRTHFEQANKDIGQIETSTSKIARKAEKIESIQLGDASPAEDLTPGPAVSDHT